MKIYDFVLLKVNPRLHWRKRKDCARVCVCVFMWIAEYMNFFDKWQRRYQQQRKIYNLLCFYNNTKKRRIKKLNYEFVWYWARLYTVVYIYLYIHAKMPSVYAIVVSDLSEDRLWIGHRWTSSTNTQSKCECEGRVRWKRFHLMHICDEYRMDGNIFMWPKYS